MFKLKQDYKGIKTNCEEYTRILHEVYINYKFIINYIVITVNRWRLNNTHVGLNNILPMKPLKVVVRFLYNIISSTYDSLQNR